MDHKATETKCLRKQEMKFEFNRSRIELKFNWDICWAGSWNTCDGANRLEIFDIVAIWHNELFLCHFIYLLWLKTSRFSTGVASGVYILFARVVKSMVFFVAYKTSLNAFITVIRSSDGKEATAVFGAPSSSEADLENVHGLTGLKTWFINLETLPQCPR